MTGETFGQMLARVRLAKVEPQMRCNAAVQWYVREPLSQNELALRAGVNTAYVHRIESGERLNPKRSVVLRLAEALDLSPIDTDRLLIAAGYAPDWLAAIDRERLARVISMATEGVSACP